MEEEYRVIKEYENYEISNFGNVKNIKTGNILKPNFPKGYPSVSLWKNNKGCSKKIHRLVAQEFLPNINNKVLIDHIDRNPLNNNISNLRWASHAENKMNVGIKRNNTSTKTGVYFDKSRNKWRVIISINGFSKQIGRYDTFDEAVRVRQEQEEIYYKEFKSM